MKRAGYDTFVPPGRNEVHAHPGMPGMPWRRPYSVHSYTTSAILTTRVSLRSDRHVSGSGEAANIKAQEVRYTTYRCRRHLIHDLSLLSYRFLVTAGIPPRYLAQADSPFLQDIRRHEDNTPLSRVRKDRNTGSERQPCPFDLAMCSARTICLQAWSQAHPRCTKP